MKFSKFGQKFTQPTGISQLMDDLGDALKSDQPVNMLGGGNPAKIDAVNELFLETYKALGVDNDAGVPMANSNPPGLLRRMPNDESSQKIKPHRSQPRDRLSV